MEMKLLLFLGFNENHGCEFFGVTSEIGFIESIMKTVMCYVTLGIIE